MSSLLAHKAKQIILEADFRKACHRYVVGGLNYGHADYRNDCMMFSESTCYVLHAKYM